MSGVGRHKVLTLLAALVVSCNLQSAMQAQPVSGQLAFPARGVLDLREGTVEAWIALDFDAAQAVKEYSFRGDFFTLQIPKTATDAGAEMNFSFFLHRSQHAGEKDKSFSAMRAGVALGGKEVPHPLMGISTDWKRGAWHHVAVLWREGRSMKLFFDGVEVSAIEFPYSIERDIPETARLVFGARFDAQPNGLWIDEIRVSSVAREAKDLGFHQSPTRVDAQTMLLENFENLKLLDKGGKFQTTPQVLAIVGAPSEYVVSEGRDVAGKNGRGLAFGASAAQ